MNEILKKNKGFTLIELLIVISIIAILASVVLISLISAREKGKIAQFKSQAKAVQTKAISECASRTIDATVLGGNLTGYAIVNTSNQSCGSSGNFSFTIVINSTLLSNICTATATERGIITFNGC